MSLQLTVDYKPYPGTELSGFEMGDLTVIGEQRTVFIQGSMLFVSLGQMMFTVAGLFAARKGWTCEWDACDISFSLTFKKPDWDSIEIYDRGRLVGGDSLKGFAQTLIDCVTPILRENQALIEQNDAGFTDLKLAVERLATAMDGENSPRKK